MYISTCAVCCLASTGTACLAHFGAGLTHFPGPGSSKLCDALCDTLTTQAVCNLMLSKPMLPCTLALTLIESWYHPGPLG